jgi:hypothetical protein
LSHEMYLGDGVYVEIENGMVKLTTRDGNIKPRDTIWLELPVVSNLIDYLNSRIQIVEYARPGEHVDAVIRTKKPKQSSEE